MQIVLNNKSLMVSLLGQRQGKEIEDFLFIGSIFNRNLLIPSKRKCMRELNIERTIIPFMFP